MFAPSIWPERGCVLFERGMLVHDVIASNICSDVKKEKKKGGGRITKAILFLKARIEGRTHGK